MFDKAKILYFKNNMSSHTTHSHTTHIKKSHRDSGFTLIELLVVISIIALLSTIVLAVVQDARVKARNTAKNNLVLEYVKALELYRSDHGSYPLSDNDGVCFGYQDSEECFLGNTGSTNLTNEMKSYIANGDFADKKELIINYEGSDYNLGGVQYTCLDTSCNYELTWVLENTAHCIDRSLETEFLTNTRCDFTIK